MMKIKAAPFVEVPVTRRRMTLRWVFCILAGALTTLNFVGQLRGSHRIGTMLIPTKDESARSLERFNQFDRLDKVFLQEAAVERIPATSLGDVEFRQDHVHEDATENDGIGKDATTNTGFEVERDTRRGTALSITITGNDSWPFQSLEDVKIYFIHVGKCGGKTLYRKLGILDKPRSLPCIIQGGEPSKCFRSRPSSPLLRQQIMGHFHVGSPRYRLNQKEWLKSQSTLLLFTVRDPVDRIVSSFNYHFNQVFSGKEPLPRELYDANDTKAVLFLDCFPTVQDLALTVDPLNSTASPHCRRMGLNLLAGEVPNYPCLHFKWNYQKYSSVVWTNRSKPVAVLRTRRLWEDVANLENKLGGRRDLFSKVSREKFTHGSEAFFLQSGVNRRGAFALCCALFRDIQIYHTLILSAVNLNQMDKLSTLGDLFKHCGVEKEQISIQLLQSWRWEEWQQNECSSLTNSII